MTRIAPLLLLALAACHSPETRQKIESMENASAASENDSAGAAQPQ